MKFGIILPNYGPSSSTDDILATSQVAERLGFDSAWTTDHILLPHTDASRFTPIYEALITLGWIAGTTKRIRLGVSSLVLPQRNPLIVAKQVAALDVLSKGRAMLCASVGWSVGEYANLGENFQNRGLRIEEAIKVLRLLWATNPGETITFHGRYYQFDDGVFDPPPDQPGGPPLWIGGHAEAVLQRAALMADGWHASGATPQEITRAAQLIQQIATNRKVTISSRLRLSFDDTDPSAPLQGSSEKIIDKLGEYDEAGLDYAILHFCAHDQERREVAMSRFVDEVFPALQGESR
jgi:probable F420-dependent oxidoreductase